MVCLAESHPSVGVVGCYQRSGESVKWQGVPLDVNVLSGREAARSRVAQRYPVSPGTPTSVLYRADALRDRKTFYPHERSHADGSACYEVFQRWDFGFVHEVLATERVHAKQWSASMDALDAGSAAYLDVLLTYGPIFLSAEEFAVRRKQNVRRVLSKRLGGYVWKFRGRDFCDSTGLDSGNWVATSNGAGWLPAAWNEALYEARDPVTAARKVIAAIRQAPPGHHGAR